MPVMLVKETQGLRPVEAIDEKRPPSTVTWYDFAQNTTFHGIRHILQQDAHTLRRLMWSTCVFVAFISFLGFVGSRGHVYLEYQASVDVEKVYKSKVPFPAVTICNQNKYRLTAISDMNLYDYINAVTGGLNETNGTDSLMHSIKHIDTADVTLRAAHQLEDLVKSCTWRRQPCNMASQWMASFTDMGVCYTFNPQKPTLNATDSGAGHGLSLTVNVELYEYLTSRQSDAGLKILLHHQDEFPMIKDLGFSVAPGTHTLVAVNRFEIQSLESPYGLCDVNALPVPDCHLQCRTAEIVEHCGCRDLHMIEIEGVEVCNITTINGCVQQQLSTSLSVLTDKMESKESNCSCVLPCERVGYEPSLSYTQLSMFGADLLLNSDFKKTQITRQFLKALETFQEVDQVTSSLDKQYVTDIQVTIRTLEHHLRTARQSSVQALALLMQFGEALEYDTHYLKHNVAEETKASVDKLLSLLHMYKPILPDFIDYVRGLENSSALEQNNLTYGTQCSMLYIKQNYPEVTADPEIFLQHEMLYMTNSYCRFVAAWLLHILQIPQLYQGIISSLMQGADSAPTTMTAHANCLALLSKMEDVQLVRKTKGLAFLLTELFIQIVLDAQPQALTIAEEVTTLVNGTFPEYFTQLYVKVGNACSWPYEALPDFDEIAEKFSILRNEVTDTETTLWTYADILDTMLSTLSDSVNNTISAAELFLAGSITKLRMAGALTNLKVSSGLKALDIAQLDLAAAQEKIVVKMEVTTQNLNTFFTSLYHQKLPVLTPERMKNMALVKLSRRRKMKEAEEANFTENPLPALLNIVEGTVKALVDPLAQAEKDVSIATNQASHLLTTYIGKMKKYIDQTTLDKRFFMENFLQVDIFYAELYTKRVMQMASLPMSRLLGEVGGLLGLLLGASLLTLCEVIDFSLMSALGKIKQITSKQARTGTVSVSGRC